MVRNLTRFRAGVSALLLFCFGCGGGPSLPPPENAVHSIDSEERWLSRVLQTPDGDIDLLESVAIVSCGPAQRPMAAGDIRGFLAPSMKEARERLAPATDGEHRNLALNQTVLPRIQQGLSGPLRFVSEGAGAQDGDCLPLSLLYAQAASALDPKNGSIRRNRAAALGNSGRLRDALSRLDKALSIESKDRKAYEMRARVRQLLGDAEGQRQDLERAASLPRGK